MTPSYHNDDNDLTIDGELSAGNIDVKSDAHIGGNLTVATNKSEYGSLYVFGGNQSSVRIGIADADGQCGMLRYRSNNGKPFISLGMWGDAEGSIKAYNDKTIEIAGEVRFMNATVANDYGRIKLMGTASNAGSLEIATADDGNEPIYVRQYTGDFATVKRTLTLLDGSGNTTIPGKLTVASDLYANYIRLTHKTGREIHLYHGWSSDNGGSIAIYDTGTKLYKNLYTFTSQTITHVSNVTGELGTFCETTGEIYDGYNKIGNTDCICKVQQSTSLNKKIVGIICGEKEFASHGDVLVRVGEGEFEVGDILCPDENGYGKVATDSDLMFMMLHAIPRPKITSLDTGIEYMVACFLV